MDGVPVLGYERRTGSAGELIVGMDNVTLNGQPFPWVTVGDWVLTFSDEQLATLTVGIVVTLPADPVTTDPRIQARLDRYVA